MTNLPRTERSLEAWWQPVSLEIGRCCKYVIGPLTLYLARRRDEWQLAHERLPDSEERRQVSRDLVEAIPVGLEPRRFVFSACPALFRLQPALLDRPVVVKTRAPVGVPPEEELTFYISTPVSVKVALESPECPLEELPTQRLSDTWFGPSTQIGELCYANRTQARHCRAEVPLRPHRAVTPVTILNKAPSMLMIERISIPVPLLSVYGAPEGTLWTEPIALQREGDQDFARVKIGKEPASAKPGLRLLAPPRKAADKHGLVRAFAGIFNV